VANSEAAQLREALEAERKMHSTHLSQLHSLEATSREAEVQRRFEAELVQANCEVEFQTVSRACQAAISKACDLDQQLEEARAACSKSNEEAAEAWQIAETSRASAIDAQNLREKLLALESMCSEHAQACEAYKAETVMQRERLRKEEQDAVSQRLDLESQLLVESKKALRSMRHTINELEAKLARDREFGMLGSGEPGLTSSVSGGTCTRRRSRHSVENALAAQTATSARRPDGILATQIALSGRLPERVENTQPVSKEGAGICDFVWSLFSGDMANLSCNRRPSRQH